MDDQQVVVPLAGLGVDRGPARGAVHQEALAAHLVGRVVAPRRAELDLGQPHADVVDVARASRPGREPRSRLPRYWTLAVGLGGTEPGGGRQPQPARPVGGGHLPGAERLHVAEPDRGGGGADQHLGLRDPQLARRQPLVGVGDRPQLDPRAGVRRPGAGRRRAGPDPAVDAHGGLGPVDAGRRRR